MAKVMLCPSCINDGRVSPKPYLRQDPDNEIMAMCPVCGRRVDNGARQIGFLGRPKKRT